MNRWRMCWWRTCLYRNSWSKQKTSCWRLGWRRCQTRRTEVSVSILSFQVVEIKQVINVCAGGFLGQQTVPEELNVKRHSIQEGNGVNEPQESFRSVSGRSKGYTAIKATSFCVDLVFFAGFWLPETSVCCSSWKRLWWTDCCKWRTVLQ